MTAKRLPSDSSSTPKSAWNSTVLPSPPTPDLAFRELDDALDLTGIASNYLQESRNGRNILHHLVPLLRVDLPPLGRLRRHQQDGYSAPFQRPCYASRTCSGSDHNAASTSEMGRFETADLDRGEEPEGAGSDEFPMGGGCHGSYSTPASNPGYGQFRESGARSDRLQRPLRVCLLSPSLSVHSGIAKRDATARQRPQCR